MLKRISKVHSIQVNLLAFSSVLQIGDSKELHQISNILAIQREQEFFWGYEGNMDVYEVFSKEFRLPPITEPLLVTRRNMNGQINVQNIDILGVSTAAVIHIGSSGNIFGGNRVMHIRQLSGATNQKENMLNMSRSRS